MMIRDATQLMNRSATDVPRFHRIKRLEFAQKPPARTPASSKKRCRRQFLDAAKDEPQNVP
jgi:hypothetical protein